MCRNTVLGENGGVHFRSLEPCSDMIPYYFSQLAELVGDKKAVLDFIGYWQQHDELPSEEDIANWVESEVQERYGR